MNEKTRTRLTVLFLFPALGTTAAWWGDGLPALFTFLYLFLLQLIPLFWIDIARGYTRKPTAKEIEGDTYRYPASYQDKWQLLFFPASAGAFQFHRSREEFLRAGFRVWEGQALSLLCALAMKPDPLDGFDEDWGLPLRYHTIQAQFGLAVFWNALIAAAMYHFDRTYCGAIFAVLGIAQAGAMGIFFLYDRYRMPRIVLTQGPQPR